MYSVVRIVEAGGHIGSDVPERARARIEALGRTAGFVTLLAINGDDGALVTVEIFETLDDLRIAQAEASRGDPQWSSEDGPDCVRTISGEIVFQRGL